MSTTFPYGILFILQKLRFSLHNVFRKFPDNRIALEGSNQMVNLRKRIFADPIGSPRTVKVLRKAERRGMIFCMVDISERIYTIAMGTATKKEECDDSEGYSSGVFLERKSLRLRHYWPRGWRHASCTNWPESSLVHSMCMIRYKDVRVSVVRATFTTVTVGERDRDKKKNEWRRGRRV